MESQSDGRQSSQGRLTQWNGPRSIVIPRTDRGFEFTLRHFIVYPPEPQEIQEKEYTSDDETDDLYFQRIQHGALEPLDTIFVKNVREGGAAQAAGLKAGDRIISVNGEAVTGKSYGQVISLIQQSSADLTLLVVPKEEDILQLAYQNSQPSYDPDYSPLRDSTNSSSYGGQNVKVSHYPPYPSHTSMDSSYPSATSSRDRKVLSTSSLDRRLVEGLEQLSRYDRDPPRRPLSTSTSYTSGLSIYREAPQPDDNMNKTVFLDRRREFEARAAQENVNPNSSKTYSFGLYFPKKESRVNSAENLSRSVVIRRSKESVLQPTDSQENISKLTSSRARNVPIEYRHSGTPEGNTADKFRSQESLSHDDGKPPRGHGGSTIRHSFPDSGLQIWTSPTRKAPETSSPYNFDHGTPTPDSSSNKHDSYPSHRHYVPVINESSQSRFQKMSQSVDSIDPRSNVFHTEHHLRTAFNNNSNTGSSEQHNQNQTSPSRTFILKIGDSQDRSNTPNASHGASGQAGNQSYGAAFAVTRSPGSAEIEIRKRAEPRILVSHRKKQFESREVSPPPTTTNALTSRYKSEIEKMPSYRKFDGIQARLASFEKSTGSSEPTMRSRSQTPVSAQPISKVRRMSQERVKSPEPHTPTNTPMSQGSSQSNYSDSAPIRIYVSQGSSSTSGSPIVEIVPMHSPGYQMTDSRDRNSYTNDSSTDSSHDQTDLDQSHKPVRKASFLSAVNAPYSRYLPQTGYDNETPSSTVTPKSSRVYSAAVTAAATAAKKAAMLSQERSPTPSGYGWSGQGTSPTRALSPSSVGSNLSISSTSPGPHDGPGVRLRNKPEISAEDFETKLHRRTSYLMATAKDRSTASLTMTSPQSSQPGGGASTTGPGPLDPNTPATLSKHKSMRKLKDFFGEKTPKIVEAQEKRQDPASPIQEVTKEASLMVKMDMIDGKRASDRSWRPVWAVLRGHALFLCKEKRDPANQASIFSYDEQPISLKSCIVDIAHGYTKKKNVFRVKTYNGCEYLFQTEDQDEMLGWIDAIKENNNPDSDNHGVTNAELIIRKSMEMVDTAVPPKTSPPPSQKMGKKLSVLSIKQKMPHSPNIKRRKTTTEKDDSGKPKTWKGKIGKSFKKQFGSSPSTVGHIPSVPEAGGMFGLPLEDCTPSPNNEFVPLLVDLCIQIVEAKGLEMTGVYRIPGNKAAVTLLQEEFNKGIESMNLEHEKWSDVNVISSLLKSFFRQLPETLITDELYQPFIEASRIEEPEKRMLKLKRLIHELPEHHFETFKHLAKHLNKVAQYGDINRMEAKNLAIIFGPTLIRKADDNMIVMFTDMSDHCKIIESIVLHCDWFFGSWDMDNYVPTDEDATECTSTVSGVTSSSREDIEEINPREIVSSIVEAANRKLRGEQNITSEKRSASVTNTATTYNERNIDQEIIRRTKQIDTTSRSSPNLMAMQRASDIIITKSQEVVTDRRMAKSQEFCDREFPDFDYIDADKDNSSNYLTPTTRYFSDELLDKNDELEMSHGTQSGNYRLSRETLDSLRRIEMEARALREREERRQRDLEKRKLEKQRIEQDILQTQQELEIEDRHSVEDLLNGPDYSQFGVNVELHKRKHDTGGYRPTSGADRTMLSSKYSAKDSGGGKYFVIKGNSGSSGDRMSRPPRQVSIESLVKQSKRTSSLENMSETHSHGRGHGRPLAHVRARKGEQDRGKQDASEIRYRGAGSVKRSNSLRRGSLDSLIDLIEKRDNRMSWASTDSEEGFDLLTTLTSTFDQKLLTLSSQKANQSQHSASAPPPPRRIPYNNSSNSLNTSTGTDTTATTESSPVVSAQHRLPPQVPLSMVSKQGSSSDQPGKQFRDPSLHRTPPKSDAKIGLATRFERTTTLNPMFEGSGDSGINTSMSSSDNYSVNLQSDLTFSADNLSQGSRLGDSNSRVSSVMVVISSPSVMSADSQQPAYSAPHYTSKPVTSTSTPQKWDTRGITSPARTEYRPISKSEKTEVNVKLSQTGDKNKNTVFTFKSPVHDNLKAAGKSRSESPTPGSNRKRGDKRKRRRHTVGGTSDSEHVNALNEATRKSDARLSAWEQLRPAVSQNSSIGPNSSMLTWLRNERLRGSSPDLTSATADKNNAKRS